MQRHVSLLTLVLATTLGTLAPALVTEGAGAASTVTQRPATSPSDIDAARSMSARRSRWMARY